MSKRLLSSCLTGVVFLARLSDASAGSINGEVKFNEAPPKLAAIKVTKDQDYCGETLPNEIYLIDSGGGLANVVIFVEAAPVTTAADPQKINIVENNGCRYAPRILAMQRGERLRVKNSDPKLHIPHSYLQEKTVFMLSLPFRNTVLDATQKIRESGIMKLLCDTHAWMLGYVHVFDHRFFAVSDERGAFSITNIPPGAYTLKAWHEDAGIKSQEIIVPENGDVRINFEFTRK